MSGRVPSGSLPLANRCGPTLIMQDGVFSLDVCVLSYGEARQLEHRNEWPQCKHHQHVKKREAAEMVAADTHRFIGGNNTRLNHPVSMITPVAIREWRPVPTAGLLGFRTWGLSQTK